MIYFDVTKSFGAHHRSGLMRVSERLRVELAERATPVVWREGWKTLRENTPVNFRQTRDWLLTPELFSEAERPGFWQFLREKPVKLAAIFHDAIPLKLPHITWPHSVARHPEYLKMLAHFDLVLAVSDASRQELTAFWAWQSQGTETPKGDETRVKKIDLGADPVGQNRGAEPVVLSASVPHLLCLGILEPRKNQEFLFEVAAALWAEGATFVVDVVGRVNPHFGRTIERRLRRLNLTYPELHYWGPATDERVQALWASARVSVFPTLAEGCGLPLLESLEHGVPCICSDLPVLRENGADGGCVFAAVNDRTAWKEALRKVIEDAPFADKLRQEAKQRILPTWAKTAAQIERFFSEECR